MILYFNKSGQLLEQLEYGQHARVGSTNFQVFAYFEGIDLSVYDSALIRLKRPDLGNSEYPDLFMVQASINYDNSIEASNYFETENNPYVGYVFNFNSITDESGNVRLLDTPGQWEASITLVSTSGVYNVTGLVKFTVEGAVSDADDEETELQYSAIADNIAVAMAQKVNKNDENYIRYNANLGTNAAQGNLLAIFYPVGCLAYDGATNAIFKIDTVTPKDETHVYATISKVWQIDNPAEVDGALSDTSENPVQNKVVTNALQNVREVAEGKCRTFVVSYNDTFESVRQDVIDNNKRVYDINGNDITQGVIDGEFGPDFDYYCLNSRFNSQSDYIDLASGIYSVVIARGLYPGFVSGEASNFYVYIVNNIESQDTEFHAGDEFLVVETDVPDRWYGNAYNAYKLESTKVDITGKLDKVTTSSTASRVYAVNTSGNQIMFEVSSSGGASTMVLRSGTGIVRGATPVDNNDLTTKQYVDNALSQISAVGYRHSIRLVVITTLSETYEFTFDFITSSQSQLDGAPVLIGQLNKFVNGMAFMTLTENSQITESKVCVIRNMELVNNFPDTGFKITFDEEGDTSGLSTEVSITDVHFAQVYDTVTPL